MSLLTAQEISFLPLNGVNTVVLSACESGLGKVASGEGLIGMQRAFQVAGVRSTITSQWMVDDHATRVLMERFYSNLWIKQMSKLDAFREAQIWMLRKHRLGEVEGVRGAFALSELTTTQR